jgi:hypothetical protein
MEDEIGMQQKRKGENYKQDFSRNNTVYENTLKVVGK